MSSTVIDQRRSNRPLDERRRFGRDWRAPVTRVGRDQLPVLSPKRQLARAVLVVLFALCLTLFVQLTFLGRFQHASAQQRMYDDFRSDLALGTAPIGPADADGLELSLGTPVAYVEIPALGVAEVIGEGTTSGVLLDGPGHRRDTPLPGQIGTSVVFGRRSTFGGPFSGIHTLQPGDTITVTTGQGTFDYAVLDVRPEGTPVPAAPAPDGSRLVLVTAAGRPLMPGGVLRVDADLVGAAVGGAARAVTATSLPAEERIMAGDPSTLWALALWLIALAALGVGMAWAWHRWGRAQAWIVGFPPLLLVALSVSGEAARLLPNIS
jgi:sortase A